MALSEILNLVWINIIENKFKVILTSLGIIVGATEEYLDISNLNLLMGSFFDSISDAEMEQSQS